MSQETNKQPVIASSPRSIALVQEDYEQRLVDAVKSITDYAIFILDAHGVIRPWNAGAERINGYKANEIRGQHFSKFYLPEDMEARKMRL